MPPIIGAISPIFPAIFLYSIIVIFFLKPFNGNLFKFFFLVNFQVLSGGNHEMHAVLKEGSGQKDRPVL